MIEKVAKRAKKNPNTIARLAKQARKLQNKLESLMAETEYTICPSELDMIIENNVHECVTASKYLTRSFQDLSRSLH